MTPQQFHLIFVGVVFVLVVVVMGIMLRKFSPRHWWKFLLALVLLPLLVPLLLVFLQ